MSTLSVVANPEYNLDKDVKYFSIEQELIAKVVYEAQKYENFEINAIHEICNDLYRQELLVVLGMTELPEMIDFSYLLNDDFDVYWKNINIMCERLYNDTGVPQFKNLIDRIVSLYSQSDYVDENEGEKMNRVEKEQENRNVLFYQLFSYHTFHLLHRLLQIQYYEYNLNLYTVSKQKEISPLDMNETRRNELIQEREIVMQNLEKTFLHMMHCE